MALPRAVYLAAARAWHGWWMLHRPIAWALSPLQLGGNLYGGGSIPGEGVALLPALLRRSDLAAPPPDRRHNRKDAAQDCREEGGESPLPSRPRQDFTPVCSEHTLSAPRLGF